MLPLEKHQHSPPPKKRFSISPKISQSRLPKKSQPLPKKSQSPPKISLPLRKNFSTPHEISSPLPGKISINPSLKNINLKFHLKFLNHPTPAKRMSTSPPPENVLTLLP